MRRIIRTKEQLNNVINHLGALRLQEPFIINVEKLYNKRTAPQLRSFWLLINIIKVWMNEQGNNFTKEDVATYFKLKAGFYKVIDGVKIAKSIADKSNTTKEDMAEIINCILDFGIDSYELEQILKLYE